MFCRKCGKEVLDEAVICVHCGCAIQNNIAATNTTDAPSTGMAVLGFFIPLVGFIIWLINKETKPLMAKSAGKGALIGFIVSVAFYIIYMVIITITVSGLLYW